MNGPWAHRVKYAQCICSASTLDSTTSQHADDATGEGTASVGLDTFAQPSRRRIESFSIIINDDGDGKGERDSTANKDADDGRSTRRTSVCDHCRVARCRPLSLGGPGLAAALKMC